MLSHAVRARSRIRLHFFARIAPLDRRAWIGAAQCLGRRLATLSTDENEESLNDGLIASLAVESLHAAAQLADLMPECDSEQEGALAIFMWLLALHTSADPLVPEEDKLDAFLQRMEEAGDLFT
jgi:hypothetical protein